jgi:hypothetical protein
MGKLFNIADEEYYLDLDKISNFIKMEPTIDEILERREINVLSGNTEIEYIIPNPDSGGQMIDVVKWETVRALIESLLQENGIIDESMGFRKLESQLSIPFRLAFNTLLKNKLIKKNG